MYEYVHNKSKQEFDFQMRLTQLPFCQHTKVKLRDKSYQDLDSSVFSKMDMDDFLDIFCDDPRTKKKTTLDVHPADQLVTQQAYLLTKSVPRRSNKSKWNFDPTHFSLYGQNVSGKSVNLVKLKAWTPRYHSRPLTNRL